MIDSGVGARSNYGRALIGVNAKLEMTRFDFADAASEANDSGRHESRPREETAETLYC